jgi:glycerol-3-phosphate dehydrogenase
MKAREARSQIYRRLFSKHLIEGSPSIPAEVAYGVREGMATTIEGVLARHIGLRLFSWERAIAAAPAAGSIMAGECGWSPGQQKDAVEEYVNKITRLML